MNNNWQLSLAEFEQAHPDLNPWRAKTRWAGAVYDASSEGKAIPQRVLDELSEVAPQFMPDSLASDEVLLDRLSVKITNHIENVIIRKEDEKVKIAKSLDRAIKKQRLGMADSQVILKDRYDQLYALKDEIDKLKDELHERITNNRIDGAYAVEIVQKYRETKRGLTPIPPAPLPADAIKVDWFVNYTQQQGSGRTTETIRFDTPVEAREFAKDKSGYLVKITWLKAELIEFFGEFEPSSQEELRIKSWFPDYDYSQIVKVKSDYLYHVTALENLKKIKEYGLMCATSNGFIRASLTESDGNKWANALNRCVVLRFKSNESTQEGTYPTTRHHYANVRSEDLSIRTEAGWVSIDHTAQYKSYLNHINKDNLDLTNYRGFVEQLLTDERLDDGESESLASAIFDNLKIRFKISSLESVGLIEFKSKDDSQDDELNLSAR